MHFCAAPVLGINLHSSIDQIDIKIGSLEIKYYSTYFKFYLLLDKWTKVQKK